MSGFLNNSELSKQYEELFAKLVPPTDKCDTIQGEMLRAATRITYDWYNNGWGCNNWSGAVVYIQRYFEYFTVVDSKSRDSLMDSLRFVKHCSHGEPVVGYTDGEIEDELTVIMTVIVQTIINNPEPIVNTIDMFSLQEEDYYEEEEQEEDTSYNDERWDECEDD